MDCYTYLYCNYTSLIIGRSLLSYSWTYSAFLDDLPRLFIAARLRLEARSNTIQVCDRYATLPTLPTDLLGTRLFPRFPCGKYLPLFLCRRAAAPITRRCKTNSTKFNGRA